MPRADSPADTPPTSGVLRHRSLMIPHRSVRPLSESAMRTGFVLYVEDNDDLRELLVELVTVAFERRCVGVGSYEELVALGEEALGCGVAILDINLGPNRPSGIDAYRWLRQKGMPDGSSF